MRANMHAHRCDRGYTVGEVPSDSTCGARRTYVEGLANKNQAATHSTLPQSASQCLVPCMHDHDRLVLLHTKLGPKKKCVRNSTSNSHSSSKSKPRNTSHRRHLTKFF
jgi:hypothetical protein